MTDASQALERHVDEADVKHGLCELDVAKMTRAALIIAEARQTRKVGAIRAKSAVNNALRLWLAVLVRLFVFDLRNRHAANLIGA